MQNGFYAVTGAMVTQFNRLDQISNNLANVNTNGFKKDDQVIGDFMRLYQEKRDELPLNNNTKDAAKFLNRSLNRVPRIVESYKDFSLGSMVKTDNKLDLALGEENLFFAVKTPDGIRLTKDGAFSLNEKGQMVTKEGYLVLSKSYFKNQQPIELPVNAVDIMIDKSGKIKYLDQTAFDTPVYRNDIMVVRVDDLKSLKSVGENLFTLDAEEPELQMRIVDNPVSVYQGMLEKSNVNPVREMSALIETNRLVEMYQKAMTTQMDDINRDAITKLASVRA
ncbi:flagellar hook-basal body protein [Hydrogenimonas thermophila]|uniref:Flagellar basal-body rod protein FlgG n=1 Tax=Hydrogenimonas thermophila TaxID=223786 RepID=A0A1I5RWY2_9BACT|nr:flagellar hook-basal body protein [Hydrogenimonas thermophila]WOE69232.1 flagellar hook-basal body protein [Hydrogenimonas thermophila]WOE71742.1 flagellar hook-basal body protein [Hydrogenimonas thermophila]SFP62801.1 flagellar basal-body rod protein FlgG [Hydrogenimonas thermophila]